MNEIVNMLALITAFKIVRSLRWQFFVNRDGNSGRDTHWLRNPRIIGPGSAE